MRFDTKKLSFIALFALIGFGAMQVPFSQMIGVSNLKFSLFDFYGPIAGAFIGSIPGLAAVLAMQLGNWALHGFALDTGTIIRFFPVLFAVLYFANKSRLMLAVPVLSAAAFLAHPEGREAWYYTLLWTIPLLAYVFRDRFIFARALGATFTQHSVGGALWIWAFNVKAELWIGLIPVVIKERFLMALGITLTYILFNYILSLAVEKAKLKLPFLSLNPKYTTSSK